MKVAFPFRSLLVGAAIGAVLAMIIGFTWGGWLTASKSRVVIQERVSAAIVSVLAPICYANFQKADDTVAQRAQLKALRSWEREEFVSKAGWAEIPGESTKTASTNSAIAQACAKLILAGKT